MDAGGEAHAARLARIIWQHHHDSPALSTCQWPSRKAAQSETSIKVGCGSGPIAQGERNPRVLSCRSATHSCRSTQGDCSLPIGKGGTTDREQPAIHRGSCPVRDRRSPLPHLGSQCSGSRERDGRWVGRMSRLFISSRRQFESAGDARQSGAGRSRVRGRVTIERVG